MIPIHSITTQYIGKNFSRDPEENAKYSSESHQFQHSRRTDMHYDFGGRHTRAYLTEISDAGLVTDIKRYRLESGVDNWNSVII